MASSSVSKHEALWRYLALIATGLPSLGVIVALLAIGGALPSRFIVESLSLVFSGLAAPAGAVGVMALRKRPKSGLAQRLLPFALAFTMLPVLGFWASLDVLIPLDPFLDFDNLTIGVYFSIAAFSLLMFAWVLTRIARKRHQLSRSLTHALP
jgi:hypothetical protein